MTRQGASEESPQPGEETVTHEVGRLLTWTAAGMDRVVYRYATDKRKPYLHPLRSRSGAVLTVIEPEDHPWHHGLWFAWKYINGVNFWEETPDGTEDGRTKFTSVEKVVWQPGKTHLTTRYDYCHPEGGVLLREERTLGIHTPSHGSWIIDWTAAFHSDIGVRLDRTAIGPKTPFGGYAGLSFRAASWHDVQAIDSEGRRNLDIKNKRARWAALTGIAEARGRAGVAMFDHPDNPRHPSYWYYGDDTDPVLRFAFLNPSFLLDAPYEMDPGAMLYLRYRLLILDGPPDVGALETQYTAFVEGTTLQ